MINPETVPASWPPLGVITMTITDTMILCGLVRARLMPPSITRSYFFVSRDLRVPTASETPSKVSRFGAEERQFQRLSEGMVAGDCRGEVRGNLRRDAGDEVESLIHVRCFDPVVRNQPNLPVSA